MAPEPVGSPGEKLLPVTVLSGFLGAGKTTLLKHILRSAGQGAQERDDASQGGEPGQAAFKVAVIVNDMGEVNLDASEIKDSRLILEEAAMVELHNGCICCTLRGDLLKTVRALSEEKAFDYLVIESTGISEPLPVAQTFVMDVEDATLRVPGSGGSVHTHHEEHEKGGGQGKQGDDIAEEKGKQGAPAASEPLRSLSHFARLDTMATVVDSLNIYDVLGSLETLAERNVAGMVGNTGTSEAGGSGKGSSGEGPGTGGSPTDDRSIAQLLLDQIEFADVILLSKAHLLAERPGGGAGAVEEIRALLTKLNPLAKVIVPAEPHFADVSLEELIDTQLFDMRKAQMSPGWLRELIKTSMGGEGHTPETEEYGISSLVFRTKDKPFHPGRLHDIMRSFGDYASSVAAGGAAAKSPAGAGVFSGVVRAKGQLWVATCHERPVHLHAAGRHVKLEPHAMPYLAAVPRQQWGLGGMGRYAELNSRGAWHRKYGDRESEVVLIGLGLDREKAREELDGALLTDEEMAGGPESWLALADVLFGGKFQKAQSGDGSGERAA